MSAILIISVFLIAAASFFIIRSKRSGSSRDESNYFPPAEPRGLFGPGPEGDRPTRQLRAERQLAAEKARQELLHRANAGDLDALADAHAAGDADVYRETLDALVAHSAADPAAPARLAAFVVEREELKASPALALALLEAWRAAPARASTAELLRVAALSGDANTFAAVLGEVAYAFEGGRLTGLSAAALRELLEAEYWVLSSEAKRTGAGFVLKHQLAQVCRRLAAHAESGSQPTAGAGEGRASV